MNTELMVNSKLSGEHMNNFRKVINLVFWRRDKGGISPRRRNFKGAKILILLSRLVVRGALRFQSSFFLAWQISMCSPGKYSSFLSFYRQVISF